MNIKIGSPKSGSILLFSDESYWAIGRVYYGGHRTQLTRSGALELAARFRASEEMYQALRTAVASYYLEEDLKLSDNVVKPLWVTQAEAALALADNTNETL